MSLAAIRHELVAIIEGVTGIGKVHNYLRWSDKYSTFLNLFKDDNDKINGVMVTRDKTDEEYSGGGRTSEREHNIKIICIYGLEDGEQTEIYFQDTIVEGICAKLRAQKTLNNRTAFLGPPQVKVVEPRKFGNVLCHYAEITVSVYGEILR
jgi:hypothetical protein